MKVKFANKVFEVLYTMKVAGQTMYAVEDEPNHIDWLVNVEVLDDEKKALNKIEQEPYPETLDKAIELYYDTYGNGKGGFDHLSLEKFKGIVKMFVDDYGMQKSAWSEDDVYTAERLLCLLTNEQDNYPQLSCDFQEIEGIKDWVASLKDRVQPQPNQEWSEEDENMLDIILNDINYAQKRFSDSNLIPYDRKVDWLKSLKDRAQSQPKHEWSEEDEEMLEDVSFNFRYNKGEMTDAMIAQYNRFFDKIKYLKPQLKQEWSVDDKGNLLHVKCIIDEVWHNQEVREEIDHSGEELESLWNWLDGIWQRVNYPQSQWKPSDEQIGTLEQWLRDNRYKGDARTCYPIFDSLYEQLKKLKGE